MRRHRPDFRENEQHRTGIHLTIRYRVITVERVFDLAVLGVRHGERLLNGFGQAGEGGAPDLGRLGGEYEDPFVVFSGGEVGDYMLGLEKVQSRGSPGDEVL